MAQLVERLHGMEEVAGSSPAGSTRSEEFGPDGVGVGRASVLISSGPPLLLTVQSPQEIKREAFASGWVHQYSDFKV